MKDMFWLFRRTMKSMLRSYTSLFLYLIAPIIGIGLAFLINGNEQEISLRVGAVNLDGEHVVAQDVISFLEGIPQVKLSAIPNEEESREQVLHGKLDAVVILPSGFSQAVIMGEEDAELEIVSLKSSMFASYVRSYLEPHIGKLTELAKAVQGTGMDFEAAYASFSASASPLSKEEVKDQSAQRDMTNRSIGYLVFFMMFSAVNLSAYMIKEKENRTYYRLLSTPASARSYTLSNVAANMVLLLVQIVAMLAVLRGAFGIDPGIPLWQLALVLLVFAWVSVAISLVIVAFAHHSMAAGAIQNLLVMPTCLLAGCMFPLESMPDSMQAIANFLPQRWLLDAIDQLQLGSSLTGIGMHLLTLVAFALAFTLVAIYKFGHNKDTKTYI